MAPIIHLHWGSSPCRGLIMTCRKAGIEFEPKFVDLFKGEHKTPEFLKMNPEHCLPTLKDGDFILWESHTCARYLVDKYAPDSDLYPQDLQLRANVNKMLDQDLCVFNLPRRLSGEETDPGPMLAMFQRLEDTVFKVKPGDTFTIADIFILAAITYTEATGYMFPATRFPHLGAWLEQCKATDWYTQANTEFEQLKNSGKTPKYTN